MSQFEKKKQTKNAQTELQAPRQTDGTLAPASSPLNWLLDYNGNTNSVYSYALRIHRIYMNIKFLHNFIHEKHSLFILSTSLNEN